MWRFLDSGSAKKSADLIRAITNFSLGTENETLLQTSVKSQVKDSLYLPANGKEMLEKENATTEELLEAVFSTRSAPKLYSGE
jgi:hypothetical protein